ncbi:MAG: GntR family transcriptional regulator [Solobacterium sp.]|nr:GntR family transcriptional regulator [Solobacterium sp.]
MEAPKLITDKVYQDLKEKIIFGQYLPGVHLVEAELIEEYSVSRTTIRAALRQLIEDEIVVMIPHKGIFVRKLTLKEVQDYYQIVKNLEGMIARQVALSRTAEQVDRLDQILAADEQAVKDVDFTQHFKNIQILRRTLVSYTGNEPLIKIIGKIHMILSIYHSAHPLKERLDISWQKHKVLLQAIRDQDADFAEDTMRSIIQTSLDLFGF